MKIRGNTVGTPMKRPDFNQTDERKSDYIKNNPIPVINEGDEGKIPMAKDGAYVLEEKAEIFKEFTEQTTAAIKAMDNKKVNAYQWRQIDEFTTEEDAVISRDYSSRNIEGIRVLISVPANTVSTTKNMNSYVTTGSGGNSWCGYYVINIGDATKSQSIICTTVKEFGLWTSTFSSYQDNYNIKRGTTSANIECISPSNKYIKKFMSQSSIPKGATITVYGAFPVTE